MFDTLVEIANDLSLGHDATIANTLWCCNIQSSNGIEIDGPFVDIMNIIEVHSNVVNIANDLSLAKNVSIIDKLFCSNIESENEIIITSEKDIIITGSNVKIKGIELLDDEFTINAPNINLGGSMFLNQSTNTFTISNDIKIFGNLECGTLTISAFEERTKTLNMALSNLTDFFEVEQGLLAPGAIFTPSENVFTKPTYFLDDCFLSSNLKIDPVFKVTVQCQSNLIIRGEVYGDETNGLTIKDKIYYHEPMHIMSNLTFNDLITFHDVNSNGYWRVFTDTIENKTCDLIFQSRNNIATAFTDEFDPNIINFTGQHRCTGVFNKQNIEDLVGKIVISTGKYSDLVNKSKININEAIPIVKMSTKEKDARVFGVVSDRELDDENRKFHIGHIKFSQKKKIKNKKYMINSVGEGGIWVIDKNGSLKNGDYICSSGVNGYGMRQEENIHYNYTVAKITCDCNFDDNSTTYICEETNHKKKYKKAFVGCVYKC